MSSDGGLRSFHFYDYLQIWLVALGFSLLIHASSFWQPHHEGDEVVYLTLAREMNWDLSHYTTGDDPAISMFPCSIYRTSLFHQPPLLPLVMKFGQFTIGNAVFAGLLFENAAIWLLLYYTWRWMVFQQMPVAWGAVAIVGITFCPLLLSSSALLHHDALMGSFMACGLVAYIEALQRPTVGRAIIAGLLLIIGLNLRYNALIFLPILVALQVDNLYRPSLVAASTPRKAQKSVVTPTNSRWLVFGIVISMVLTLGLQHYYRILATYGSLMPSSFLRVDPNAAEFSPYLRLVFARKPWKTALDLVLIYPILLSFLIPAIYAPLLRGLRERSRAVMFTPIFLYLLVVEFYFSYSQLRYFATITPCLFLGLPYMFRQQSSGYRKLLGGLAAVTLIFMLATGFMKTQVSQPDSMLIIPAPLIYLPPLRPLILM